MSPNDALSTSLRVPATLPTDASEATEYPPTLKSIDAFAGAAGGVEVAFGFAAASRFGSAGILSQAVIKASASDVAAERRKRSVNVLRVDGSLNPG